MEAAFDDIEPLKKLFRNTADCYRIYHNHNNISPLQKYKIQIGKYVECKKSHTNSYTMLQRCLVYAILRI